MAGRWTRVLTLQLGLACAVAAAPAQQAVRHRLKTRSGLSIHKNVGEVVVDLQVTDAHGKLVENLQPAQLQVLDNGRRQNILSFRRVSASVHLTRAQAAAAGLPERFRAQPINLIVLVFDRLGLSGRVLARQAARQLVADLGGRDYAAVFAADGSLAILQNFTLNRRALMHAVEVATGGSTPAYRQLAEQGKIQMLQSMMQIQALQGKQPLAAYGAISQALTNFDASTAPGPNPYADLTSGNPMPLILTHILARDMIASAGAEAERRSWASLGALARLVHALRPLSGRKELALFSESLRVNGHTSALYHRLVREANRAGVSFYPVDPAGLSVKSSVAEQRDSLNYAAAVSQQNTMARLNEHQFSTQAHEFDTVAEVKYAGRLTALAALAADTGGFLSARSNDLGPDMRRLADDLGQQYELTYSPASGMDGAYHTLALRVVGHRDWNVRARKGYYAIPRTPTPVAAYALPALALLLQNQPKRDFPFAVAGYQFPADRREPRLALVAAVPLAGLKAHPATRAQVAQDARLKGRELLHLVVLQLVRDRRGRIVRNFSRQYEWSAPAAELARFQAQTMIIHHTTRLPAGAYTVQTAIYQPQERAASLESAQLQVPAAGRGGAAGPRLSSIVPISSTQPLRGSAGAQALDDPLNIKSQGRVLRIEPSASGVLQAAPGKPLGFYFIVYLPAGAPRARLQMKFFRRGYRHFAGGVPFAGLNGPLPRPDRRGQIPVLARIEANALPAGRYRLRVKIQAGAQSATGRLEFAVAAPKGRAGPKP